MQVKQSVVLGDEIKQILIADIVLIVAFSLTLSGGIFGISKGTAAFVTQFFYVLPICALAVTLSFILHELMHKFVAQRYGAIAGFQTSPQGLAFTLITGAMGFLMGIPGATVIYVHNFTKEQNGIVSLAGPLTNFVIFFVFLGLLYYLHPPSGSYIGTAISFTIYISILLAFFNMLPIFPLDGSKVFVWNKGIYAVTMGAIFLLMLQSGLFSTGTVEYLVLFALVLSFLFRNLLWRM